MAPFHRPVATPMIQLEGINSLQHGCLISPASQATPIATQHREQDILTKLTGDFSPGISIHNYGQLYICNAESCHHGRKANLPKEIGQALARTFSFVKKLRRRPSRRQGGALPGSSEAGRNAQAVHKSTARLAHSRQIPELDYLTASACPEMPAWSDDFPTMNLAEMETPYAASDTATHPGEDQERSKTTTILEVADQPQMRDRLPSTPCRIVRPESSTMSPISPSWLGSGSDRSAWQMSQYSDVSEITPQTSMSESDVSQTTGIVTLEPWRQGILPTLYVAAPPLPQEVVLDGDLNTSPTDGDFDVMAIYEQLSTVGPNPDLKSGSASWSQAHRPHYHSRGLVSTKIPDQVRIGDEMLVPSDILKRAPTTSEASSATDVLNDSLSTPTQPRNFTAMLLDAFERFAKDMSSCCPSDIVIYLNQTSHHAVDYWQEQVDNESPQEPFTLMDICDTTPTIQEALWALHVLVIAGRNQEDLEKLQRPSSQQLMSLAFLGFSLLCLAIPQGKELTQAISALHQQAMSWSGIIQNPSEAAIYKGLINRFWLLRAADSHDIGTGPSRLVHNELNVNGSFRCNDASSDTFVTDIALIFIRLVANTVSERRCELAAGGGHMLFDSPPSFDDFTRESLESSNGHSKLPLPTSFTSVFEKNISVGECRSFEEVESCLGQELSRTDWLDSDMIAAQLKKSIQKTNDFFKGRVVMWLWRILEQGLVDTSRRAVGSQFSAKPLKGHASARTLTPRRGTQPPEVQKHPFDVEQRLREDIMTSCNAGRWVIKTQTPVKPQASDQVYPCDMCPQVFYGPWGKGNLRRHKKNTLTHGKEHESCPLCGRTEGLIRSDHLAQHMKKIHLLVKDPAHKHKWIPISPSMVCDDNDDDMDCDGNESDDIHMEG